MSFDILLALSAIIFDRFGVLPVLATAADVTCYWCSSIVGGKVYSNGCKAKSDNVNNTLQSCQGRTCLLAKAVVKDSGKLNTMLSIGTLVNAHTVAFCVKPNIE
jgi:hypothetical protein